MRLESVGLAICETSSLLIVIFSSSFRQKRKYAASPSNELMMNMSNRDTILETSDACSVACSVASAMINNILLGQLGAGENVVSGKAKSVG